MPGNLRLIARESRLSRQWAGNSLVRQIDHLILFVRLAVVDPKRDFAIVDVNHRHGSLADLEDITDGEFQFVNLHH